MSDTPLSKLKGLEARLNYHVNSPDKSRAHLSIFKRTRGARGDRDVYVDLTTSLSDLRCQIQILEDIEATVEGAPELESRTLGGVRRHLQYDSDKQYIDYLNRIYKKIIELDAIDNREYQREHENNS